MSQPYLSVVIPAYNEPLTLPLCLQSQVGYPNYEIIVVDNNSTDDTVKIAREYGVKIVSEKSPGVCAARDAGFKVARGEIVVSTDSDCIHPVDWLAGIGQAFTDQPDLSLLSGNYRFQN